jgi:glyoxylase-like metal-dependent hydrolase (beta-lactamase superfamily II)
MNLCCVVMLPWLWIATALRSPPAATKPAAAELSRPTASAGQAWPLGRIAFSLLPLAGSGRRKTVEAEIIPGQMWTHDQLQGVINVNVPVRQVVVKLTTGGLLVYNPVAPTDELVRAMRELEAAHGPVRHVVLGTLGLEHKALAGPFSRAFPDATCWVHPGQWEFPLSLPLPFLGFPSGPRLRTIPKDGTGVRPPEWAADFEWEVLGPLRFKAVGAFGETALIHRATRTLLVTDTIVSVSDSPRRAASSALSALAAPSPPPPARLYRPLASSVLSALSPAPGALAHPSPRHSCPPLMTDD